MRCLLTVLCLIAARPAFPQKVKGAGGRWAIVNITPEQARERAIEEAKKEALRKAGIPENIKVAGALSSVEDAGQNRQLFSEFSNIEMHGAVTDYIIVKDVQEKEPADGLFYAVVEIDATVKKYRSVADPEFKIDVRGLRNNGYKNGEAITFSVHPNKEGYLKIFLFENMDVAAQVFPNDYEENRRLEAKHTLHFPLVESISYTAEKSASGRQEHNLLLFVYTKSDVPFYGAVTSKRVLGWINGMEPDEREVVVAPLMISD